MRVLRQSDTTTDSYAAVPAVEQTVSLPRLGRAPRLGSQLCLSDYLLVFVWRPFWPDPDRTGESDRQSSKQVIRGDLAVLQQDRLDGLHRLDSQSCASNASVPAL